MIRKTMQGEFNKDIEILEKSNYNFGNEKLYKSSKNFS
jgi:hypothetical protein